MLFGLQLIVFAFFRNCCHVPVLNLDGTIRDTVVHVIAFRLQNPLIYAFRIELNVVGLFFYNPWLYLTSKEGAFLRLNSTDYCFNVSTFGVQCIGFPQEKRGRRGLREERENREEKWIISYPPSTPPHQKKRTIKKLIHLQKAMFSSEVFPQNNVDQSSLFSNFWWTIVIFWKKYITQTWPKIFFRPLMCTVLSRSDIVHMVPII